MISKLSLLNFISLDNIWFAYAWFIFIYLLIFKFSVKVFKYISCRQHIDWYCFLTQPKSHHLILECNLITFLLVGLVSYLSSYFIFTIYFLYCLCFSSFPISSRLIKTLIFIILPAFFLPKQYSFYYIFLIFWRIFKVRRLYQYTKIT